MRPIIYIFLIRFSSFSNWLLAVINSLRGTPATTGRLLPHFSPARGRSVLAVAAPPRPAGGPGPVRASLVGLEQRREWEIEIVEFIIHDTSEIISHTQWGCPICNEYKLYNAVGDALNTALPQGMHTGSWLRLVFYRYTDPQCVSFFSPWIYLSVYLFFLAFLSVLFLSFSNSRFFPHLV